MLEVFTQKRVTFAHERLAQKFGTPHVNWSYTQVPFAPTPFTHRWVELHTSAQFCATPAGARAASANAHTARATRCAGRTLIGSDY